MQLWYILETISQCSNPMSSNVVVYNAGHEGIIVIKTRGYECYVDMNNPTCWVILTLASMVHNKYKWLMHRTSFTTSRTTIYIQLFHTSIPPN